MKKIFSFVIAIILLASPVSFTRAQNEASQPKFKIPTMVGRIGLIAIFPDSDGTGDFNQFDWNKEQMCDVVTSTLASLQKSWSTAAPQYRKKVSFELAISRHVSIPEEPVNHTVDQNTTWVAHAMKKLGYGNGDPIGAFDAVDQYAASVRGAGGFDSVSVVFFLRGESSQILAPGSFAYLGGPYSVVSSSDLGVYGFLGAFEIGHLYYAFDEHSDCTCQAPSVRPFAENGNCIKCPNESLPCFMRGVEDVFNICRFTAAQVGWNDFDIAIKVAKVNKSGKLIIKGSNFDRDTVIFVDGVAAMTQYVSPQKIKSPAVLTQGTHSIRVENRFAFSEAMIFSKQ